MPFYGGSAAQGYSDSVEADSQRQVRGAEVARLLQAISQNATTFQNAQQDRTRALDTRQGFGNLLYGLTPPGPGQTGPLPPAPGQASVPAMPPVSAPSPGGLPPPPGASGAPAPAAAPAGPSGGAPALAAPPLPPYRAVPEPQPGPDGTPGAIPPPPAAAPQPEVKLPSPMSFLAKIKAAGVDPGKAADYLDQYAPLYKAQQDTEFKQMQAELRAQQAAMTAYKTVMEAQEKKLRDERENRRLDQGDRRIEGQERRDDRRAEQADRRENRLIGALAARNGGGGTPGKLSEKYESDPEYKKRVDFWAKHIANGGTLPARFAQSVGGAFSKDVYSAVPSVGGGDSNDLLANKVSLRQMNSEAMKLGTQSASVAIANKELERFIPLAEAAIDAVPRTDWKPLNALIQAGQNTWSPEQKRLVIANRAVQTAYAQLIQRGAPTVHSSEEAEKMLMTADSPDVYKAATKQLLAEGKAAEEGLVDAHKDLQTRVKGIGKKDTPGAQIPATNAKGWTLKKDAKGNQAYVSPDGKQFEEVK